MAIFNEQRGSDCTESFGYPSSLAVNPVHSPYATNRDYHPAPGSLPCADQGP